MILTILPYIQIIISLLLVVAILLQKSSSGLGSAFGGGGDSGSFSKRRGMEKILFNTTIVLAFLFIFSAFLNLLFK